MTYSEDVTITIIDGNDAPTDLAIDSDNVDENESSATVVGALTTTDVDAGDSHTYSVGGADAASFAIDGANLVTAEAFDFETKASYSISITTTDSGGLTSESYTHLTLPPSDLEKNSVVAVSLKKNEVGGGG